MKSIPSPRISRRPASAPRASPWASIGPVLLAGGALAVDAVCACSFAARPDAGIRSLLVAALHVACAGAFGWSAHAPFPRSHRRRDRGYAALAFTLALLVPVVGPLGLTTAMTYGLRHPRLEQPTWSDVLEIPSLLHQVPRPPATIAFTADALAQILGGNAPNERRFRAILATRSLAPRQAIPLLKVALSDASDEVRLLGFSRLEGVRREIELRIKARLGRLETADPEGPVAAALHHRVAEDYWELAFLGLVEGEVYRHTLRSASEHVIDALSADPENAGAALLLARVSLRLGDVERARLALEDATELGIPAWRIAPYAAEVAFREGRFHDVPGALRPQSGLVHDHIPLAQVVRFWNGS